MMSYFPGSVITLLLDKGDKIVISGKAGNGYIEYKAKGTKYNEQLSTLESTLFDDYSKAHDARKIVFDQNYQGDKEPYRKLLSEAMGPIRNNEIDFIRNNLDEPISAFLLSEQPRDTVVKYYDALGEKAVYSGFYQFLDKKIEAIKDEPRLEEEKRIKEENRTNMVGKPAPDFTLKDVNGRDFTLSSLRGKYVLLDFWGSWCGWCLIGFPELKQYYSDHPGEFEIVGIACRDTRDAWVGAVKKHELPWINVVEDPDDRISATYNIWGYPTHALIDKDGTLKAFLDQTEVYDALDKIRLQKE